MTIIRPDNTHDLGLPAKGTLTGWGLDAFTSMVLLGEQADVILTNGNAGSALAIYTRQLTSYNVPPQEVVRWLNERTGVGLAYLLFRLRQQNTVNLFTPTHGIRILVRPQACKFLLQHGDFGTRDIAR